MSFSPTRYWTLILTLLCCWLIAGITQAEEEAGQQAFTPVVEELITIKRDYLLFKGKKVPVPFTRKKLIEVFGKPSREIYNAAGTVVIWDELGLTCYGCHKQPEVPEEFQFMTKEEKKQVTRQPYVNSITLFVRKYNPYPDHEKRYAHEPKNPFPGKLELEGVELDGSLSFAEFLEQRKGRQTILLPENAFSFYINCTPEPHEITLHTIRDKYDDDFMSIYSISIRNIGHYYQRYKCTEVFDARTSAEKVKKSITEEEQPSPAGPPGKTDDSTSDKSDANRDAPQPVQEELFGPPNTGSEPAEPQEAGSEPKSTPTN